MNKVDRYLRIIANHTYLFLTDMQELYRIWQAEYHYNNWKINK
jgi:hypothetical protein